MSYAIPLLFEGKPRWPGAPPVCLAENRLAFKSVAELMDWRERNSPRCSIKKVWLCDVCKHWHHIGKAPDPAGSSSGTGRSSK